MTTEAKLAIVKGWIEAGKMDVSPAEAAPLLGKSRYALYTAAKQGHQPPQSYFFSGCNARFLTAWLLEVALNEKRALDRLDTAEGKAQHTA